MGRRYRRQREENGAFGEFVEFLLDLSKKSPRTGLILGVVLGLVGGGMMTGGKAENSGAMVLIGMVVGLLGFLCLLAGGVGWIREALRSPAKPRLTELPLRPNSTPPAPPPVSQSIPKCWTRDDLTRLDWRQFESLIADLFRRRGYTVRETGREADAAGIGDGGMDLILTRAREPGVEHLVQCKHYLAWDVGEPKVREFFGAMAAWRTRNEGLIITTGRFSGPARTFAMGKPIRLIDGEELLTLLNQTNPLTPVAEQSFPVPPPAPAQRDVPVCPRCRIPMVKRLAQRGTRAGDPFWGCPNYPRCTSKIDIAR